MKLPDARGPLGTAVNDYLLGRRTDLPTTVAGVTDVDDRALTLWTLFELHYRGFDTIDPDLEWDPDLVRLRSSLEAELESALRADFEHWDGPRNFAGMLETFEARPGVAGYVRRDATTADVRHILRQRSIYHLKESDPHCFVLPRLDPAPKAALAELQYDELGGGRPDRVHSQLFADALDGAGLDSSYGAYVDEALASTLTSSNALSMLCLRRRLRFAAAGHLAAFEATSSLPCADIVHGLRRLDLDPRVIRYYDEHVEADAVHEQLAWRDICGRMVQADPSAEGEVLLGAYLCLELESRNADDVLESVR